MSYGVYLAAILDKKATYLEDIYRGTRTYVHIYPV